MNVKNMTKRKKLKTNSSPFLVLISLLLLKVKWTNGDFNKSWNFTNSTENFYQFDPKSIDKVKIYVGNDAIAKFFYRSSSTNDSLILKNVKRCLENFQLLTCLKMLLLERINNVETLLREPDAINSNFYFFNGLISFEKKNMTENTSAEDSQDHLSLDEEITAKIIKIFQNRSLKVNLPSKNKLEIQPIGSKKDDFICFSYKIQKELEPLENDEDKMVRGRKRKSGGMSMMSILPPLLMLGFMPFTLASLKAMVMNAVMINMMALNGAIFMTIRNLVFGPRCGDNVKYVNYGYSKNRQSQSPKPVLIIHSPAAFVKQPKVHKKAIHRHFQYKNQHLVHHDIDQYYNHNDQFDSNYHQLHKKKYAPIEINLIQGKNLKEFERSEISP